MRIEEEIINVKAFIPNCYIVEGCLVSISTGKKVSDLKNQSDISVFGDNCLVTRDLMGCSSVVHLTKGILDKRFKIDAIGYPFFTFYEFNDSDLEGIYDSANQKIVFETKEWLGRDIIGDYIFTTDITCGNVRNGDILWHFDLLSIPDNPHDDNYAKDADWEVKKFIGILEDKLWIALNHHTIIAVDIHTGSLVHQIHDIPGFKSDWLPSAIPLSEATVIDVKNNRLIGFMWEFYWEIDPQSGAVTLLDLSEDFLKEKIRNDVHHYVLTDDIIYFISHFDSKIGAFERVTKRIVWHYDFVKDETTGRAPRIRELQGDENQLGALSSDNTLYIFKKED